VNQNLPTAALNAHQHVLVCSCCHRDSGAECEWPLCGSQFQPATGSSWPFSDALLPVWSHRRSCWSWYLDPDSAI